MKNTAKLRDLLPGRAHSIFLEAALNKAGLLSAIAMIDREHDLSITKQAEALNISRGSVYYLPRPVSTSRPGDHAASGPTASGVPLRRKSRMLRGLLVAEGCKIGRRHVKTLMRRMGIEALYRRPRTTKPEPGHKIYPYLLRGVGDHAAKPGVGDGHHLHPDGARLRLSGGRARLVQPSACCHGGVSITMEASILRRGA